MTVQANDRLLETIKKVVARIDKFQDRKLGEQGTKASLIEPILEALGWDTADPDEVQREYKRTSKANPVDYALCIRREPRLLTEAKGLGETLTDEKWVQQVLGYAAVTGVGWCVLTNGDEYQFYNTTAAVDFKEKRFCTILLSAGREEEAAGTLNLISKSNMEGNIPLDELWKIQFVDRRVKEVLLRMQETRDKGLVRLIRKRSPKLTVKNIIESLRRLDVRIELPSVPIQGKPPTDVSLAEVVEAGLIKAGTRLFRKYKGQIIEATLLPDGQVEFRGVPFATCSAAAVQARATVTGRQMSTNGWTFWQFTDVKGNRSPLDSLKKAFCAGKQET